jgi:IPT/TIG domain
MNIKAVRSALLSAVSSFVLVTASLVEAAIPVNVNGQTCAGASVTFSSSGSSVDVTVPASCVGGGGGAVTVSGFSPTSGSRGTPVTITGTGFSGTPSVTIGGVAATDVRLINSTTILAIVGANAALGAAPVSVTAGTSANSSASYTVVDRLANTPYVSNVLPPGKKAGETISIIGFNFIAGTTVTLNGLAATVSNVTATQVDVVIPASLTAGGTLLPLVLTVPNAATNGLAANYFAYTVAPTGSSCGAGADCTIAGAVIPTPSKAPGVIGTPGPDLGLPVSTFYQVDPATRCANATPAIGRLWQHNIDFAAYQGNGAPDYVFLQAGDALTYRFTAPPEGAFQQISYNSSTVAAYRAGFMSISTKPCDFDTSKVAAGDVCYVSQPGAGGATINYKSTNFTVAGDAYQCKMVPGATYYFNIRMQDARPINVGGSPTTDACNSGSYCGGILIID